MGGEWEGNGKELPCLVTKWTKLRNTGRRWPSTTNESEMFILATIEMAISLAFPSNFLPILYNQRFGLWKEEEKEG